MKSQVLNFLNDKKHIEQKIKEYIQDKSIPFTERFEVFKLSSSILETNPYLQHVASFEKAFGDAYYEVYFWNRGDAKTWGDMFEHIWGREDGEEYFTEDGIPTEKMIPIIEDVMAEGYAGFTFDW